VTVAVEHLGQGGEGVAVQVLVQTRSATARSMTPNPPNLGMGTDGNRLGWCRRSCCRSIERHEVGVVVTTTSARVEKASPYRC
jgi:hypothetical protein